MEKPDRIPTVGGPLEIQPVDHASMVLRHGAQTIYVDPVGGAARYAGLARPSAILVTHHHGDHLDTATLEGLVGTKAVPMLVSAGVLERLPAALKAQIPRGWATAICSAFRMCGSISPAIRSQIPTCSG